MILIRFIIAYIRKFISLLKESDYCRSKDELINSSTKQIVCLSTLDGYTITDFNGNIITIKE